MYEVIMNHDLFVNVSEVTLKFFLRKKHSNEILTKDRNEFIFNAKMFYVTL